MTHAENNGPWRSLLLRLLVTGIVLALWFWTQSLIGARTTPGPGIRDGLHNFTAGLNSYFSQNGGAANALLIASSGLIDALGLFLDRKSTRLNSSHSQISYAVFCLKP